MQQRQRVEGRYVPKEAFIHKFFEAYGNVAKIKLEFGDAVMLRVIVKDYRTHKKQLFSAVTALEDVVKIPYTEEQLVKLLHSL